MHTSLRPLLLAPLLLALAPVADEIAFHPAANTEVGKKLTVAIELKVEDASFTVNGESMDQGAMSLEGQDMLFDLVVGVTEKYVESRDGHPIDLLRTYDDLTFSAEVGDEKQEPDEVPKLQGKTVRFKWNEEEKGYDRSWHEGEGPADKLESLSDDMDLRLLLPTKKVAVGDTWQVAGESLLPLFLPGFSGGDFGPDEVEGDGAKFLEAFEEELGDQFAAAAKSFQVRCTYKGERDEGGVKTAEIGFDFAADPKFDLAGLIDRLAREQGEQMPDFDVEAELGFGVKGEGTLLWNPAAGHLHAFDMQSDLTLSANVDASMEQQGQQMEIAFEVGLGGKATWKLALEKR